MTEQRATVRVETSRVVRAVVRFVNSEYEPGSATGRLSIHETRVVRRGDHPLPVEREDVDMESEDAVLEALSRAIRRTRAQMFYKAVYAPPGKRLDVVHEAGVDVGKPLRCVARPRRLVAQIVNVKSSRHSSGGESGVRLWRLEFACLMGKLPRECQNALVTAVKVANTRIELGNQLAAARSDVERLRGSSKKKAAKLRAEAAGRLRALEVHDRESAGVLDGIVRGAPHRYGLRRLEQIISASPEIEQAIFPEEI